MVGPLPPKIEFGNVLDPVHCLHRGGCQLSLAAVVITPQCEAKWPLGYAVSGRLLHPAEHYVRGETTVLGSSPMQLAVDPAHDVRVAGQDRWRQRPRALWLVGLAQREPDGTGRQHRPTPLVVAVIAVIVVWIRIGDRLPPQAGAA